jgi:hypothetical protein
MRATSIVTGVVMLATTAFLCIVVPANRVIAVGDDASALRAFKFYGYPTTMFSVVPCGVNGRWLTPAFFRLGGEWHLRVWHDDRIQSITHFLCVPHEHQYSDFIQNRDMKSFTIPSSSLSPYCVGLAVLLGMGWAAHGSKQARRVGLAILLLLVVLGNLAVARFAESVAMFPVLISIGWVAAFLFGTSVFQPARVKTPRSRPEQAVKRSASAAIQP